VILTVQNTLYYVDVDATGDDDGTSWTDAYNDLQDALDAVSSGDEIWVAEGTYKPSELTDPNEPRTATFELVNGIAVYGGFTGTETSRSSRNWVTYETILSGDIGTADDPCDNCVHVVYALTTDANTTLDGFTVTKGYNEIWQVYAGGAGLVGQSVTVNNCKFTDNFSKHFYTGGAVNFLAPYEVYSESFVSNCIFQDNNGDVGCGIFVYSIWAIVNIDGCLFNENTGGVWAHVGSVTITDSAFINHDNPAVALFGYSVVPDVTVINCLFAGNSSPGGGGAIYNPYPSGDLEVINSTFYGNTAATYGGAILTGGSSSITNCILWGNDAEEDGDEISSASGSDTTLSYCDIEGGWDGPNVNGPVTDGGGNINSDPNFVDDTDPDGDDNIWMTGDDGLAIDSDSPCIDAADGSVDPTTDILGNSRYDDSSTTDTGTGDPNYVDIGAYEYQG
jgi:predicted outer membrane repeat protein